MAGSGELTFVLGVVAWIDAGASPDQFPAHQRDKDDWQPVLRIWPDGRCGLYERTHHAIMREDPFTAIGSGAHYALAAMHLGHGAAEAVRVAAVFDHATGNTVDVLTLAQPQ